jgi:hypothetical protein
MKVLLYIVSSLTTQVNVLPIHIFNTFCCWTFSIGAVLLSHTPKWFEMNCLPNPRLQIEKLCPFDLLKF